MSLLRSALDKIGTGFLYGIGFGVSVGAIYYFITERMMNAVWLDVASEKVVITKHEKLNRDSLVLVLGAVENQGTEPARALNIQVDLFDKTGKFVDQCTQYLPGTLRAGESRNFKVSCGGKDKPVVEHETYKIRIGGT